MDVRRFVRPNADWSTVTTVLDLETAPARQTVRDTWQVTPPPRKPQLSTDERRYGGARTVGETHDNGTLSWMTLVGGASADAALVSLQALLAQLEQVQPGLYLEWRPDGATNSVFYEVRGPATWKPNYTWAQFAGAHSLTCEVQLPVAPLALGVPYVEEFGSSDLPAVFNLASPIPGDAPALGDIRLQRPATASQVDWALIAWSQHPTAGSDPAPWGILSEDNRVGVGGYMHGAWRDTSSTLGSHTYTTTVDCTRLPADPFSDELTIEVWGRFEIGAAYEDVTVAAWWEPAAGGGDDQIMTVEFGSAGRAIPDAADGLGFVRLGTLTIPADDTDGQLVVFTSWSASSATGIGLDYVLVVPANQRASGATGKADVPTFLLPTGGTAITKAIMSDLSGRLGAGALTGTAFPVSRSSGLGGSLIELPVGDVDVLIKLAETTPDYGLSGTGFGTDNDEDMTHTVSVRVTPRWHLARGT